LADGDGNPLLATDHVGSAFGASLAGLSSIQCQGIKDSAVWRLVTSTLRNHITENALKPLQIRNATPNVGNVPFGEALYLGARKSSATDEPKKHANVLEGETQFTRPPDEDQALLVLIGIKPVSATATRWARQDPDPFVVADRLDVRTGLLRQRTDGQSLTCIHRFAQNRQQFPAGPCPLLAFRTINCTKKARFVHTGKPPWTN